MKLHYAGEGGDGYGWGVCNHSLRRELAKHAELVGPYEAEAVFMPLVDHDLNPATLARARRNVAYTFFEFALGPLARENAARYDTVFAGSTWCLDRLRERGITNTALLIQGADVEARPPRTPDGQLRVFSGGKFEWRKGQDLVIASFKRFADRHPTAHLVCSWFNPWPQLIQSMQSSPHIRAEATGSTQGELFASLLVNNGIEPHRFTILPHLGRDELLREMADTDFGVFPNRCEGGTNLVLMEYLALGRVACANIGTGHADIRHAIHVRIPSWPDAMAWATQEVDMIVAAMEIARTVKPSAIAPVWRWADAAQIILRHCR